MAGGTSLLIIFAVLCLTVFTLLSLSTVQADNRLSEASVRAVENYYAADLEAEEIFSALRAGEIPETVTVEESVYSYTCRISDTQELTVKLQKTDNVWTVLKWQAVSTVTY